MALRRIVVLKGDWLAAGWARRSFAPVADHLSRSVRVQGVTFDESRHPVPVHQRVTVDAANQATYGWVTGPQAPTPPAYSLVASFDDQDAIERLKVDAADAVHGIFADPRIEAAPPFYCSNAPVGDFHKVATALGIPKLRRANLTGRNVRIAVVDTGIHGANLGPAGTPIQRALVGGYSPLGAYRPGSTPVNHGTMVAFDIMISAPDAKFYDYALLQASAHSWASFLSDALAAFADLLNLLQREPGPLVVNNSWGLFDRSTDAPVGSPENYSANPNHPFNQMVGSLVAAGADVLFAAGNCGEQCPDGRCGANDVGPGASIHGANSHPSVITVAAATVNRVRLGYSSQGPGGLVDRKPDIAAYSHFAGSGVYEADGGTSAASPVAAGVVATLRQAWPKITPAEMKGLVQRTADPIGSGWNYDVGYGVISADRALEAGRSPRLRAGRHARSVKSKAAAGPAWMLKPTSASKVSTHSEQIKKPGRR